MIETLLFILLGIGLGAFTGLFPGIHLNTVAAFLVWLGPALDLNGVLLIVAMNVTQVFLDWIPSILLGVPGEENALTALPGHRLFLQGNGLQAIELGISGSLIGFGFAILLTPLYAMFVGQTAAVLTNGIPLVLTGSLLLLIASEKNRSKKIAAIFVMVLAGSLGLMSLRFFENQLFSLVTGFFGLSTVLFSIFTSTAIVEQKTSASENFVRGEWKNGFAASVAGLLVSLFPALSSSQAALVCQQAMGRFSTRQFLVVNGAITASATLFSFIALITLGKARTGSAVAVQQLFGLSFAELGIVLSVAALSAGIGCILALNLAGRLVNVLPKINYVRLNKIVFVLLVILCWILSGAIGIFIMAIAASIGILCHAFGIKKSHCMAFLVIPTIGYYAGF